MRYPINIRSNSSDSVLALLWKTCLFVFAASGHLVSLTPFFVPTASLISDCLSLSIMSTTSSPLISWSTPSTTSGFTDSLPPATPLSSGSSSSSKAAASHSCHPPLLVSVAQTYWLGNVFLSSGLTATTRRPTWAVQMRLICRVWSI
jgi:hypothetical protein